MKTYYTFKTIRDFQRFLRTKEWREGELDYVTIGSKVFTMHEYDESGSVMSWGHKASDTLIECNTANRYDTFRDAVLYRFPDYGLRDDISYAQ